MHKLERKARLSTYRVSSSTERSHEVKYLAVFRKCSGEHIGVGPRATGGAQFCGTWKLFQSRPILFSAIFGT